MEVTFNQLVRPSPELREFTEYAARVASGILGISPPTIHFFEIVAPSRDPDLIVTEERCIGFYKNGEIYSRLDLLPGERVRNIFHEVSHAAQHKRACKTLRFYSDEIEERTAFLFCEEHCSGLRRDASEQEARAFLAQIETRFSLELRKKIAPAVEAASARIAQRYGIKKAIKGIEYR